MLDQRLATKNLSSGYCPYPYRTGRTGYVVEDGNSFTSGAVPVSGMVPIENLIIDKTVIDCLRKYGRTDIVKKLEYDNEFCDDRLLPLTRMSEMLQDVFDEPRPPIDLERSGRAYRVTNGRHRLVRALMLGEVMISTGHEDFVIGGGERNPGPDKPSRAQSAPSLSAATGTPRVQDKANGNTTRKRDRAGDNPHFNKRKWSPATSTESLAREVSKYHRTEMYRSAVGKTFKSAEALARFNQWVEANASEIDPGTAPVCMDCGSAELALCAHFVTGYGNAVEERDDALLFADGRKNINFHFNFVNGIKRMFAWPKFKIDEVNNHDLGGFTNELLGDDFIIPPLYNYIQLHMNTSYEFNGVDARALRLVHCNKLMHRWMDDVKMTPEQRTQTSTVKALMLTVQRVCDNAENAVLYAYNSPTKNFSLAWVREKLGSTGLLVAAVLAAGILMRTTSLRSRSRVYTASTKLVLRNLAVMLQATAEITLHGSALMLRQLCQFIVKTLPAVKAATLSGLGYHY
jgi:hypothetical protein